MQSELQIDVKSAQASLADIDIIVARLKQSSFYRGASMVVILWGALVACGYVATFLVPREALMIWIAADSLGVIATVVLMHFAHGMADFHWRIVVALLLFFVFGLLCCRMGHFGPRELDVFWPILFMFGYALAGLWLGRAFTILGVTVAALSFAGYLLIGHWLDLYLTVVDGGGLILAGLWMRQA